MLDKSEKFQIKPKKVRSYYNNYKATILHITQNVDIF